MPDTGPPSDASRSDPAPADAAAAGLAPVGEPVARADGEARPSFRGTALAGSALVALLMVSVLAVILFAFFRIIGIAERSRDEVVPAVLRYQEQATMAMELSRSAEMILGARDRKERAEALDDAEGIAHRFSMVIDQDMRSKLDSALHSLRRNAYRADVLDALNGSVAGHLARLDALLPPLEGQAGGQPRPPDSALVPALTPPLTPPLTPAPAPVLAPLPASPAARGDAWAVRLLFEFRHILYEAAVASSVASLEPLQQRATLVLQESQRLTRDKTPMATGGQPVMAADLRQYLVIFDLRREYLAVQREVRSETAAARQSLASLSDSLSAGAAATASENAREIVSFGRHGVLIAVAALGFGLLVMAGMAFFLMRHVVSPVLRAHEALDAVQKGQTAVHVPPAYLREFHAVGRSVERLGEVLAEITVKEQSALRSQEQLRFVFDVSPVPLVMSDMESSRVVVANKAACALFRVAQDTQEGRLAREFWVQPRRRDEMIAFMQREGGVDNLEAHMLTAAGTDFWARTSARPVVFEGRPVVLAAFYDITDQKAYETRLHGLVQELEASNRDLEQFAYAASHDLQEPVRLIMSYLQLLDRKNGPDLTGEGREFLAFATEAARRMQGLIVGLLDYARIGRSVMPPSVVSLDRILVSVRETLQVPLQESGGSLEVLGSLPEIFGDAMAFERLFLNLVSNSLKYRAADRAPRVVVSSRQTGEGWDIAVADNGVGIPAEHAGRVFQIFQRLQADGTDVAGTGIGLAICRKIMDRHGGQIRVDTTTGCEVAGQGCTFHLLIPQ